MDAHEPRDCYCNALITQLNAADRSEKTSHRPGINAAPIHKNAAFTRR